MDNDRDYVVKIPNLGSQDLDKANKDRQEEFEKAEKLREIINNYINKYYLAGAQALENTAAPVHTEGIPLSNGQTVDILVMPKADGEEGFSSIFGNSEKGKSPILIYGKEVAGDNSFSSITDEKMALSIALQKAMILRTLNDAGYSNIDTKL